MRTVKGKISWIDILNPTRADLEFLKKQHRFHPIILDELLHLSVRSRVEFYKTYLYLTYHLPIYDKKLRTSRRMEIDFLVTKEKVITIHYEDCEPIENFYRSLSNNTHFKERALGENSARAVYYLIQEIINFSMRQIKHVEENISHITQEIFKRREAEMLEKISYVKRDILDYSIISHPQEILLNSFLEVGAKFWGDEVKIYLNDLIGDYYKVTQLLENYHQVIGSLEATNGQLLGAKTNAVMQRFTILAFLTVPLALFASLASVDFIGQFLAESHLRFWIIFGATGVIVIALVLLFRKKGWL
ncbi:MAG: CorA family divalent cation transporter [Patescibacteria group bacterium]